MIEIVVFGIKATLEDGKWICENKDLEKEFSRIEVEKKTFSYEPNPELALAEEVVKIFGGKITKIDQPDDDPPGTIY